MDFFVQIRCISVNIRSICVSKEHEFNEYTHEN